MTERQRIGEVCAKDVWALVFRCLGMVLFPVLWALPLIVVWRIFFYNSEDYWRIVRFGVIYVSVITLWVWLTSYKTVFECDGEVLCVIKKWCLLWKVRKKQIFVKEIKQLTFAEVRTVKREPTKFEKALRLKLMYNLVYKLGKLLLNKGKTNVCLVYGEQAETITIADIKKNDERYVFLQHLKENLVKE